MASGLWKTLTTSIVRKQLVALTGLMMISFLLAHLAGLFTLYGGPALLEAYSKKLHQLGPLLWIMRAGLLTAVLTHMTCTISLVLENRAARGIPYSQKNDFGGTTFAKRTMIYTGILIASYVCFHLHDFTFSSHAGPSSMVDGQSYGVGGVVWNAFGNPAHALLYMVVVCVVGLHLSNAVQGFLQTLGLSDRGLKPYLILFGNITGIAVALGFGSIPVYILLTHLLSKAGG